MNKITVGVAGISFTLKENPDLKYADIKIGETVFLFAEPENAYDPKAIRIEYQKQKIGYVPRKKDGVPFVIQSWCHSNLDVIHGEIDQIWYKGEDGSISFDKSENCEIVGIDVILKVPDKDYSENDVIITKHSFSEPDVIVDFNDTQHIYNMRCNGEYKVLKGGTTFIKRFYKPFDGDRVSRQCAKYWGVESDEIQDLWASNGKLAGDFGTVVHYALEHYINHEATGKAITAARKKSGKPETENYAMPKHPILKKIIKSCNRLVHGLDKKFEVEEVVAEALITDSATGWGGLVDRLAIIDRRKKIARVQDYKVNINAEVIEPHHKPLAPFDHLPANKLTKYALQMSFYAGLLKKHGWTIEGLDVFIYEDKWVHHQLPMIDFKEALKNHKKEADQQLDLPDPNQ